MVRWRYQPVWRGDERGRVLSLCEVYLDENGALEGWTENPAMSPIGEDINELGSELARMMSDAFEWEPVEFDKMEVGMVFEAVTRTETKIVHRFGKGKQ
jgi:hypothetical protein